MNLRQKIKQSKKELALLENATSTSTSEMRGLVWDMNDSFTRRRKLEDVVNCKRKFNSFHNNESILKGKKITHMQISCGFDTLFVVKNKNGKPLSTKQREDFLNDAPKKIQNHVPVILERYKNNDELPNDFYVLYCLFTSVDRSKSKRLVGRKYFYQFKNNRNLYVKEDGKFVRL